MIVTNIMRISFDPVKEYLAMNAFEKDNPDWKKSSECTVNVTFEKKETFFVNQKKVNEDVVDESDK